MLMSQTFLSTPDFWQTGSPRIAGQGVSVTCHFIFIWTGCCCPSGFQVTWQSSVPSYSITPPLYTVRWVLKDFRSFGSPFVFNYFGYWTQQICSGNIYPPKLISTLAQNNPVSWHPTSIGTFIVVMTSMTIIVLWSRAVWMQISPGSSVSPAIMLAGTPSSSVVMA